LGWLARLTSVAGIKPTTRAAYGFWSPRVRAQLQSFAAVPPYLNRRWTLPLLCWSSCCNSCTAWPPSPAAPSHPLLLFHPPLLLPRLDISLCFSSIPLCSSLDLTSLSAPVMNELLLPCSSLSAGKQGKLLCLVPLSMCECVMN
jgi:hypothetical protein